MAACSIPLLLSQCWSFEISSILEGLAVTPQWRHIGLFSTVTRVSLASVVYACFTLSAFCVICVVPGLCACLGSGNFATIIAPSPETFHFLHVINMYGQNEQVLTRLEQVKCYQYGNFYLTTLPISFESLIAPLRETVLLTPEDKEVHLTYWTDRGAPTMCDVPDREGYHPVLDPQEGF